ncbi:unnamed protein product [Strongylus vulgaris]|uniref:NADP-dependent oxidoreductase domain-containing protein n=1 Tax=Strongylus vulgaris TaxID=40348 RepID=A0A3P7J8J3_STRVU|nr:unnamed protein product [Strongylus vulgaris]
MPFNATDIVGGTQELNDGNRIPKIGLGTAENRDQDSITNTMHASLKAGYRLIDTAEHYSNEEEIGNALKENLPKVGLKRDDIFITTKVQIRDKDPNWTEKSIKQSLEKLRTDYLDMVLVHYPRDRQEGKDEAYEVNKKGRKETWQRLEGLKGPGTHILNFTKFY